MDISELRALIDGIDAQIVTLLNQRAGAAKDIGEAKQKSDRPAYVPERESQVLGAVSGWNPGPLSDQAVLGIFREIISACRALEEPLRIAYWGPPASNTHVAARRRFGRQGNFVETASLPEVFDVVARGQAQFGVVPVENSTEGVIARTLDSFLTCDLQICSEIYVPIQHNLLSLAPSVAALRRVYSMPQATGQCRRWIDRHLQHVELIETSTTARGAQLAAADPEAGAVANPAAAEEYSLQTLAEHIEDNPRNHTRFWVIGELQPAPSGRDKTSLLFSVPHSPGALVEALSVFARNSVSLTFIESRPTKETPWEYVFFVDVMGHQAPTAPGRLGEVIEEFRRKCLFVRVLGSYPEAEAAPDPVIW